MLILLHMTREVIQTALLIDNEVTQSWLDLIDPYDYAFKGSQAFVLCDNYDPNDKDKDQYHLLRTKTCSAT